VALPPGINGKTLTFGADTYFDGVSAFGRAYITAPVNLLHVPSATQLFSSTIVRPFVNGTATFEALVPNDAPGLSVYGWTYHVRFEIAGARVQPPGFDFVLYDAGPSNVDGDSLVPVPSSAGTPVSVSVVRSLNGATGDLTTASLGALGFDGGTY
jgi:hypothetical protein